jgi:hypothetical protein
MHNYIALDTAINRQNNIDSSVFTVLTSAQFAAFIAFAYFYFSRVWATKMLIDGKSQDFIRKRIRLLNLATLIYLVTFACFVVILQTLFGEYNSCIYLKAKTTIEC